MLNGGGYRGRKTGSKTQTRNCYGFEKKRVLSFGLWVGLKGGYPLVNQNFPKHSLNHLDFEERDYRYIEAVIEAGKLIWCLSTRL
ncbi:hypothetical protein RHMOL_Rhmol06G0068100 [Rhododendron molle]|uniref:Uncharacterized protein n=1 Tax=Rhododendron molle TaxID=49168 RepID=A0ACC0NBT7_RHOML|nr:hypothetical protein RHMOL_Rhmol06G0068100 [Rhododendron molle]